MSSEEQSKNPSPLFLARELSWVDFNDRVLGEGLRTDLPLLERLKYLSIVSSNFDEFFMVRVAAIKRLEESGGGADSSEINPGELLQLITWKVRDIIGRQYDALMNEILPGLAKGDLNFMRPNEWSEKHQEYLESYFVREIYPLLTPLRLEDASPLPSIDNYNLYAAFLLKAENDEELVSIIRIPQALERMRQVRGGMLGAFIIRTLEYLRKGGRIGLVESVLGNMLNLKPVIFVNGDGVYQTLAKARGFNGARTALLEEFKRRYGDRPVHIAVVHGEGREDAELLLGAATGALNAVDGFVAQVSPVLGAHTGPSLLGLIAYEA